MGKKTTPSFIHELPLLVSTSQEKVLLMRMDMARQLYNACVGESLKRLDLMGESTQYQKACALSYADKELRSAAFREVNERFGFSAFSLHKFAVSAKNACHIGDHLDVHTVQKIASRAFDAVQKHAFNKRGRPRFKGKHQLVSVESKSNAAGIRFRTDEKQSRIEWSGLKLPCLFDKKDKHGVQAYALSCRTKYVRLVCRRMRGKNYFSAQLVQEGLPKQKTKKNVSDSVVALDLGPSTYAIYAHGYADLQQFCKELESHEKAIKRLQRALDRSRRATNPENYHADGTAKKGTKIWTKSKNYQSIKTVVSELHRKQAAQRKSLHGKLANEVLALGSNIHLEILSYKSLQRNFGKSVGFRAPGTFVSMLSRKAESAGGKVIELATRKLKLSQTCSCGAVKKKPLSQRQHICECGVSAQRDLYSAYLAYHVQDGVLDTAEASRYWPGAEPLLKQAVSRLQQQSANARSAFPQSFALKQRTRSSQRQSGSPVKEDHAKIDVREVAAAGS
jgi:transposase